MRRFEAPVFHGLTSAAENPRRLINPEAAEVIYIVKHSRCDQEQTVEAIKQPAMTGNAQPHVFDPNIAFDRGQHEIAELPGYAHNISKPEQFDRRVNGRAGKDKMSNRGHQRRRQKESTECAAECFVRAGVRDDFTMTKRFARDVSEDVVQFDGEDNQHHDRTKIIIIGNIAEMTEAMPKEEETDRDEADPLGISMRLIR